MLESKVDSRMATPEEIADMDRRVREKYEGPTVRKWQPTLTREQYFELRASGKRRDDLILKYYNNESEKLAKQLREWGIRNWKEEMAEVEALVQGKSTALTITKEEYLQRRAAGEGRMRIIRSLNIGQPRFFKLLESWGIRELDAEERALEMMAPVKPASEVDRRTAEVIEQKAEIRGLIAYNEQQAAQDVPDPALDPEQVEAAEAPVDAKREQELANLQAACAIWRSEAEKLQREKEALLDDRLSDAAQMDRLRDKIRDLEQDRDQLLQTIQRAVADSKADLEPGIVVLRIPILSASVANAERLQVYNAVEALSFSVESAEIDRERVMRELFMLLQRTVSFITADLAELLPGQDVNEYVQRFFTIHNGHHIATLAETPPEQIAG